MQRILVEMKVKEKLEANNTNLFKDKILKRQMFNLANSAKTPVITSVFGEFANPMCHVRIDLN